MSDSDSDAAPAATETKETESKPDIGEAVGMGKIYRYIRILLYSTGINGLFIEKCLICCTIGWLDVCI